MQQFLEVFVKQIAQQTKQMKNHQGGAARLNLLRIAGPMLKGQEQSCSQMPSKRQNHFRTTFLLKPTPTPLHFSSMTQLMSSPQTFAESKSCLRVGASLRRSCRLPFFLWITENKIVKHLLGFFQEKKLLNFYHIPSQHAACEAATNLIPATQKAACRVLL